MLTRMKNRYYSLVFVHLNLKIRSRFNLDQLDDVSIELNLLKINLDCTRFLSCSMEMIR
jgi:hypothetical protein